MQNLTLSITQFNNYIKNIFDNEELLFNVSIFGEVSNFKISNGIAYFDIKEEGAQLACVKFSCFLPFAKNGDKVLVTGRPNFHVKLGKLSFIVNKVEPYGMGELYKKYLELKARLESEGLFDQSKKKPLPRFVNKIGVVTSETGAVIRDIYHVVKAKNPKTDILVYPAKVQGANAEKEIAEGIVYLNEHSDVDVIIVARGGGSFEDLAPFNTEYLARVAFESKKPIISAVGHETDFSILDFASDLRAPTPSVAGELAAFNYYEELQYLEDIKQSLEKRMREKLEKNKTKVVTLSQFALRDINNYLKTSQSELIMLKNSIILKIEKLIDNRKANLNYLSAKLEKSNPLAILKSGYAKVMAGGQSAKAKNLKKGDRLTTYLIDGEVVSIVESVKEKK